MSATIGIRAARTILPSAAVLSTSGHETRIKSAPASSQRRIWSIVAAASEVRVLVIVCTVIGASPPTGTLPTMIWRLGRRTISRQGRTEDMAAPIGPAGLRGNDSGVRRLRLACRSAPGDIAVGPREERILRPEAARRGRVGVETLGGERRIARRLRPKQQGEAAGGDVLGRTP